MSLLQLSEADAKSVKWWCFVDSDTLESLREDIVKTASASRAVVEFVEIQLGGLETRLNYVFVDQPSEYWDTAHATTVLNLLDTLVPKMAMRFALIMSHEKGDDSEWVAFRDFQKRLRSRMRVSPS